MRKKFTFTKEAFAASAKNAGEVVLTSPESVITFGPNGIWIYTPAGMDFIPYGKKSKQAIIKRLGG